MPRCPDELTFMHIHRTDIILACPIKNDKDAKPRSGPGGYVGPCKGVCWCCIAGWVVNICNVRSPLYWKKKTNAVTTIQNCCRLQTSTITEPNSKIIASSLLKQAVYWIWIHLLPAMNHKGSGPNRERLSVNLQQSLLFVWQLQRQEAVQLHWGWCVHMDTSSSVHIGTSCVPQIPVPFNIPFNNRYIYLWPAWAFVRWRHIIIPKSVLDTLNEFPWLYFPEICKITIIWTYMDI